MTTCRGLFAGQQLRVTGQKMEYGGKGEWLTVKALGLDGDEPFFIADTVEEHPEGAIVYNKNVVNGMTQYAVKGKTASGFTLVFGMAPPEKGGGFDWFLVR